MHADHGACSVLEALYDIFYGVVEVALGVGIGIGIGIGSILEFSSAGSSRSGSLSTRWEQ